MADIVTTERQTFKLRLLAVLLVALSYFVVGPDGNAAGVVALAVIYLLYAIVAHELLPRWSRSELVYAMIVIDAVFLGMIYHWSGNAANLVIVLFPLTVPFYAVFGAYNTGFFAATALLVTLAVSQTASGRPLTNPAFLTQIPLFYLLAALSGYLAQGRIRRLEEQEALQRLVRLENGARSLSGAVRTIQEAADLSLMLQELVESAPDLTGLPECLISLLDRKSGALVSRAATTDISRLGVDRLDYVVEWPRDNSLSEEVLASHQPIALREITNESLTLPPWAERLKVEAVLAVPMASREVDAGVVFFYGVPAGYAFSDHEVTLAQRFANIVALVAVNAQFYEDVQVTIAATLSELRPVLAPRQAPRQRKLTLMELGDLVVDIPNRQAKIGGKATNLTPTEFDLLAVLAENSGHVVDQETLLRRVWGDDYNGRSTVVDVGVHRLRRKIEDADGAPRRIITVRGSGYMLVPGSALARQEEER
jgi:DNA-binding winged helix-turn-helix (wHTH) protein